MRMITSRKMRLAGHIARMEKRNAYWLLVGKPEVSLERPTSSQVDNIQIDFGEIVWGVMDLIDHVQEGTSGRLW
jgi:hypothetical protein